MIASALIVMSALLGQVERADNTILVFTADWCAACRDTKPEIEKLRSIRPVKIIDVDQDPVTAQRYRVNAIPAFVVVDRDGVELTRATDERSAGRLSKLYDDAPHRITPPTPKPTPAKSDSVTSTEQIAIAVFGVFFVLAIAFARR